MIRRFLLAAALVPILALFAAASAQAKPYLVGAATRDINPGGAVNLGGFGLGDGTVIPDAVIGRGGFGGPAGEHIGARAMVFDDGQQAIAIADIETQGMFAAYQDGPYGLSDMAAQVERDTHGALRADHILIASDHTHSGPDTIGAWGGVSQDYLRYIHDQTVAAIEQAFVSRKPATVKAGESDASDLIYNQACTEALNQSKEPDYPGPDLCATPGKDGGFRVVQATKPNGKVIVTFAAFAAHATAGGGNGLNGDSATGAGVHGKSTSGYGGVFEGGKAQVRLVPKSTSGRPTTGSHAKGELYLGSTGNLYICVTSGTPGTWRKVTTTAA